MEAALNSLVAHEASSGTTEVVPGLWHRTKQEKLGNPMVGLATKLAMLGTACWSYVRFAVARASPAPG